MKLTYLAPIVALAVLTGCSAVPTGAGISSSSSSSSSEAPTSSASPRDDPDVKACMALVAEWQPLASGSIKSVVDSGGIIDYETMSGEVSTFAVDVRDKAGTFNSNALKAVWTRTADNGDTASQALLAGNQGLSLSSLTTFIRSTTAGITQCTTYMKALTG